MYGATLRAIFGEPLLRPMLTEPCRDGCPDDAHHPAPNRGFWRGLAGAVPFALLLWLLLGLITVLAWSLVR
jgi:hypothetical protein